MEINSDKYSAMTTDWYEHKVVFGLKSSNHFHGKCCSRGCLYEVMSGHMFTCSKKVDTSWCFPFISFSGNKKFSIHLSNSPM